MIFIPNRNYKQLYRPKLDISFTRAFVDDGAEAGVGQARARVPAAEGKYHLYHSEGGESQIRWLTRINIVFIVGNGALLALELLNPFFGFWHGLSEGLIVLGSLIGSRFLHHYSSRMVNDLWIYGDGKHVEIQFMNAFFLPRTEKMRILNFGYLAESRIHNLDCATYQQERTVYINLDRNAFHHQEHQEVLKRMFSGQELTFSSVDDFKKPDGLNIRKKDDRRRNSPNRQRKR